MGKKEEKNRYGTIHDKRWFFHLSVENARGECRLAVAMTTLEHTFAKLWGSYGLPAHL